MSSNKKNHWISQRPSGQWADQREGCKRASGLFETQQSAFESARNSAEKEGGEVVIKNREGKIREKNTYGKNDQFPPKG